MGNNKNDKKSFIGKLAEELEIEKESQELTDTQKLQRIREESSALKDRKRLITKSENKAFKNRSKNKNKNKKNHGVQRQSPKTKESNKKDSADFPEKKTVVARSGINKKVMVLPVILIIIVSLLFVFSGRNNYSKEELYVKLNDSIREKNPVLLSKILDIKDFEATANDYESYLDLLTNNEEYREKVFQEIYLQSNSEAEEGTLIQVKETGRRRLFFRGYRLEIEPLQIESLENGIIIKKKGQRINIEENENQIVPGRYLLEKNEDFLILQQTKDLYLIDHSKGIVFDEENSKIANETIDITGGNESLQIRSNEDAIVFVNNKNTEMDIENFNEQMKSLHKGDIIRLVASLPWGYAFSKEYVYNEEKTADLPIEYINENSKKLFTDLIKETVYNDKIAYEKNDVSALTTLTGKARSRDEAWIEMNIQYGNVYLRDYYYMLMDYNNMEITKNRNGYEGYLGGYLNYREKKYNAEYDDLPTDDDYKVYNDAKRGFHFEYNEELGRWLINTWGTTYRRLDRDNVVKIDL